MASDFPIQYYTGVERGMMNELFAPASGQTFIQSALVVMDGSQTIVECATDAVSILGISKAKAADKFLWQDRVPVSVISTAVEYGMCVTGTLAASHVNTIVGVIKKASGNWGVDVAEVTLVAFHITKVDVLNQIAWGNFIAAACQFDAIVA